MGIGVSLSALSNHYIFQKVTQLNKIGDLVIGIYLIHFIFVINFKPLKFIERPFGDILYTLSVIVISYYSVFFLYKNKRLRLILFSPRKRFT